MKKQHRVFWDGPAGYGVKRFEDAQLAREFMYYLRRHGTRAHMEQAPSWLAWALMVFCLLASVGGALAGAHYGPGWMLFGGLPGWLGILGLMYINRPGRR